LDKEEAAKMSEAAINHKAQAAEAEQVDNSPVEVGKIKGILDVNNGARMKSWLGVCAHCGFCADSCFFYLAHDKDPTMSPAYKVKTTLGELYKRKGEVDREFLREVYETVWGKCTMCRRCSQYCPFGIDLATMIGVARACCNSQGILPEGLARTKQNIIETGNQMAMSSEDWVETCKWMAEEYAEEVHGLEMPVDVPGAKYMYTVNPREPMYYPQDLGMMAEIMHLAGDNWCVPSTGWDCTNLAMFAGDKAAASIPVKNMYDKAVELGVEQILMTECGHAYRSGNFEGPYWLGLAGGQPPVPVKHSVQLFWEYIVRDKCIKIDPDKMPDEVVTLQDPCNVSRSGGLWELMRELTRALVKDFRDMSPNREYNHCCGGGGGFIPMGSDFKRRRMASGKVKAEQIKATGATKIIVPCHNCFDQINDLNKEYDLGVKVVSFKELITESMIIPQEFIPPEEPEAAGE
jgi:Fe-S oxidoreductase